MTTAWEGGQGGEKGEDIVAGLEHMVVLHYDIDVVFLTLRLRCKVMILIFTCHELSCCLPTIWCPRSCVQKATLLKGNDRNKVISCSLLSCVMISAKYM